MPEYTFSRYLSAKKSVDDRALNRHVWDALQRTLNTHPPSEPLRILEIGAGIGTMLERIHEWHLTPRPIHYTALDSMPENIEAAKQRLTALPPQFTISLEAINLFDFIQRESGSRTWDLIIAHAFLDLIDIPKWLPLIFSLAPGGYFYFTINFDGLTILEPPIDPIYDTELMRLYHQTMDDRLTDSLPSGDSQSGRHLFTHLATAGAQIHAAGSSDWIVHPPYPADEAYFLHFIIHTIHTALIDHPAIDPTQLTAWSDRRHQQITDNQLTYLAHQLDFFGLAPDS